MIRTLTRVALSSSSCVVLLSIFLTFCLSVNPSSPRLCSAMSLLSQLHSLPRVALLCSPLLTSAPASDSHQGQGASKRLPQNLNDEELGDDDDLSDDDLLIEGRDVKKASGGQIGKAGYVNGEGGESSCEPSSSSGLLPLPRLVPRLWPLMRHHVASVRLAAVETLVSGTAYH